MIYRTPTHPRCTMCGTRSNSQCTRCKAPYCQAHLGAENCGDCASRELGRQRRIISALGIGLGIAALPVWVVLGLLPHAGGAVWLVPGFIAFTSALFAIPAVVGRLSHKQLPEQKPRPQLPAAADTATAAAAPKLSLTDCATCAESTTRCSRCERPLCADHALTWAFYTPTSECGPNVGCHGVRTAAARPPLTQANHGSKKRFRRVGPGIVYM